jgi:Co/Zn/Cd efflux system component
MVQSGLHAFSWGLQRLGVVLAMTLGAALLIIVIFVVALIGIDAAGSFGQ